MESTCEVRVSSGRLQGEQTDGVRRFLGIPYALPPFGERRFRDPQPVAEWEGVLDATAFGPTAPQSEYEGAIAALVESLRIDGDDILTVNVWAPADVADAPVLLWIHGGAFERGTAARSIYDGAPFARDGVVFVSVNYRLGSEGFSVLDDAPRNLGLQDVAAALRWVRSEIAAFGGDPSRITLMGESAGGALVAGLLTREDTKGLVAGAIIQSGPLDAVSPRKGGRITTGIAKALGIATSRDRFAELSPEQLLDARRTQSERSTPLGVAPGFQLVIDPSTLPRAPREALVEADVPLLIGTNTDEYRMWFTPDALDAIGPGRLLLARLALRISKRAERAVRREWPGASTGEVFGQLASDLLFRAPMTGVARARHAPTFVYEFAWSSPVRDLRASHALELGFVFDALDDAESLRMTGSEPPQRLADEMRAAWSRFAISGDPGWPEFDGARITRVFDVESTTEPQRRTRALDHLP